MRSIDQMVQTEVICCLSHMVAALADCDPGALRRGGDLVEQAQSLCTPVDDWEEAARQVGWTPGINPKNMENVFVNQTDNEMAWPSPNNANGWEDLCNEFNIEPYQREVFEHWAVTEWLAEKLEAKGERVDRDFGNLCVWGRTTSGQGIASDSVIKAIYAETHKATP